MALTDYVIMPGADYQAACDAVRAKTNKTELIKSGELANEINSIASGLPLGYQLKEIVSERTLTFAKGASPYLPKNPVVILADKTTIANNSPISKGECGLVIFDGNLYVVYMSDRTAKVTWANGNTATTVINNAMGNFGIPTAWANQNMTVAENDREITDSGEPFFGFINSSYGFVIAIPENSTNLTHTLQIFKFVK